MVSQFARSLVRRVSRLLPVSLTVFVHHLLRHVLLVAKRRHSNGLTVRAPPSAHPASAIRAVRTRAASLVARDGLLDDLLLYLRVRLGNLRGLCRREAQRYSQEN